MTSNRQETNYPALSTLITVFFFWGFIAAGNSIFIPFCKHKFHLDQFQSQLVDTAFYFAYYIGALLLFVLSSVLKKDIVGSWGYKKSIIYGLLFSALGAATMILAVESNSFPSMLFGLFIVALGFSLQQTSANPFAIQLGDAATGNTRINLGGGINSLGTTIGPLVVAFALFGSTKAVSDEQIQSLALSKVIVLYSFVGALFLAAAALFAFSSKVPNQVNHDKIESSNKAMIGLLTITMILVACFIPIFSSYLPSQDISTDTMLDAHFLDKTRLFWLIAALSTVVIGLPIFNFLSKKNPEGWGALKYPQLSLGMIAIFVYVGVEVAVGSNLGELLKQPEFGGYSASEIAPFIAMYWGSLMIGRWTGAIAAFSFSDAKKSVLKLIVPFIAFATVVSLTYFSGHKVSMLLGYVFCVILQIFVAYTSKDKPARTLLFFSLFGASCILVGLFSQGQMAVYAFLSAGLACSIMWPCIFSLAIAGLGKYTTQGSAFLIMMILGGAIIPPIQGKLADLIGIHSSFFVAAFCFLFLAGYAFYVKQILRNQGLDYE